MTPYTVGSQAGGAFTINNKYVALHNTTKLKSNLEEMYAGTTSLVQCVHCGHIFRVQQLEMHLRDKELKKQKGKSPKTFGKKKSSEKTNAFQLKKFTNCIVFTSSKCSHFKKTIAKTLQFIVSK